MPSRALPNNPSLEHLRKEAKRLRDALRARDAAALAEFNEFHPRPGEAIERGSLADAQLVTARSFGFGSWTKLKQHVSDIEPLIWNPPPPPDPSAPADVFLRLACLTYASWDRRNPERAHRMLSENPDLSTASVYTAAATGNAAAVREMIDRNPALIHAPGGPLKWQPLLYACYSRMDRIDGEHSTPEVARLLLSRGADANAGFLMSGRYAFTALTGAFGRGEDWHNQPPHPECDALARLLLDAGADPNDSQALYNRHFDANDDHLKLLLAYGLGQDRGGPWLQRLGDRRFTPGRLLVEELWSAAKNNYLDRVRLLLDHGADMNTASLRNDRTPYEEALRAGNEAVARYLLDRGARKIELDPLEDFALVCIAGRREEIRARLASDPTLLERLGHHGRVEMLHRALDRRLYDGIRLIVELGVDINGLVPGTGLDRSVLHSAAGWGGLEMVKFLIGLGADPTLRDPTYGATPLGWAMHSHQDDVIEYLIPFASIFDVVRCGAVERAAALLESDPSLANARDDHDNPLVFYLHPETARLDEMIELLARHGMDVMAPSRDGRTALERALASGWMDLYVRLSAVRRSRS